MFSNSSECNKISDSTLFSVHCTQLNFKTRKKNTSNINLKLWMKFWRNLTSRFFLTFNYPLLHRVVYRRNIKKNRFKIRRNYGTISLQSTYNPTAAFFRVFIHFCHMRPFKSGQVIVDLLLYSLLRSSPSSFPSGRPPFSPRVQISQ